MALSYLYAARLSRALHPRGDVHRVAPDVIVRFASANHAGRDGAVIDTCTVTHMSHQRS